MSRSLRDSAERSIQKTLLLMQKGKQEEALKELEKAEKAAKILLKYTENEFFSGKPPDETSNNVFTILEHFLENHGTFSSSTKFL